MMFANTALGTDQNFGVKYIESGEITIAATATSNTHTLAQTVDKTKAYIVKLGDSPQGATNGSTTDTAVWLDDDGVTVHGITNSADPLLARTVAFQVVEMYPWAVWKVQHFALTIPTSQYYKELSANNGDFTLDTPNPELVTMTDGGETTTNTGQNNADNHAYVYLNIYPPAPEDYSYFYADRFSNGGSLTKYVCLIEWLPPMVSAVQTLIISGFSTGVDTVDQVSISPVDLGATVPFMMGYSNNGFQTWNPGVSFVDSSHIKATYGDLLSGQRYVVVHLVTFNRRYMKQKIDGSISMANGDTTKTDTSYTFKKSRLILSHLGTVTSNPFSNTELGIADAFPSADNVITAKRYAQGFGVTTQTYYQGVETP